MLDTCNNNGVSSRSSSNPNESSSLSPSESASVNSTLSSSFLMSSLENHESIKTTTVQQPQINLVSCKSTEHAINFASALNNYNNNFSGYIENNTYLSQSQQGGYPIVDHSFGEYGYGQEHNQYGHFGPTPLVDYYNCKSKTLAILILSV